MEVDAGRLRLGLADRLWQTLTSTRGRLTLLWLAISTVALAIANIGVYLAIAYTANAGIDRQLRSQAQSVSAQVKVVDGRPTYTPGDLPDETSRGLLVDMALLDSDAVLQQTEDQPLGGPLLHSLAIPALRTGQPSLIDFYDARHVHRHAYVVPLTTLPNRSAAVVASSPLTDVESSVMRTAALVALLSVALLVGSTILVSWLIGCVLRPVKQIANLAESLGEGDLHRRVEVKAPNDEVGQLVKTFNRMLARLDNSFAALRSFTADASHELRSPLTLMSTELEYVLIRRRSAQEQERVLRALQDEVTHMTDMVDKLLMLARVDAGQLKPAPEQLNVFDFVHETAARWVTMAADKEVTVEIDVPDSGTLLADPLLTRRILDNLIDNGIRHSPPRSRLRVGASRNGGDWLLEVSDHGPGIPSDQRNRIFERFARSDTARATEPGEGAGLGLPLSLAFARLQGGDLSLVDRPGWGAVFQARVADGGRSIEGGEYFRRKG